MLSSGSEEPQQDGSLLFDRHETYASSDCDLFSTRDSFIVPQIWESSLAIDSPEYVEWSSFGLVKKKGEVAC